ncbi:MAG TPA: SUMF1/EgtB/PvdO family nonheme iron enzyme, partial [Candidatus Xenobia bacterium]
RPVMDAPASGDLRSLKQLTSSLESELKQALQKVSPSSEPPPRPTLPPGSIPSHVPDLRSMVFVPGGEFWMGSDDKDDNERPMHKMLVEDFYIDPIPVTNRQYLAFVQETGYQTEAEELGRGWIWVNEWKEVDRASWRYPTGPGSTIDDKLDHPVVLISWNDAQAYCQWAGKRLPSEAEWEKAARGTDGRRWPWGNEWDKSRLNSGEAGPGCTSSVNHYPQGRSQYGCMDLAGNVWEWVQDCYRPYPGNNGSDEDFGDKYRVLRGGSWDSFGHNARCANRTRNLPRACVNVNGFRCASSAPQKQPGLRPSNLHESAVPPARISFEAAPLTLGARFLRAQELYVGRLNQREGPAGALLPMGLSDIEGFLQRHPFLFRNGQTAHSLAEMAEVCQREPEMARHHLRTGDFTTWLKGLGWADYHSAERIAKAYPGRELPYFLALVMAYGAPLRAGQPFLPPSEEVLERLTTQFGLSRFKLQRPDTIITPKDNGEMIVIAAGEFLMGSSDAQVEEALGLAKERHSGAIKAWFLDEAPMHVVHLDSYAIDKYPVTNAQFATFVKATRYEAQGDWRSQFTEGKESHPVVYVTWYDACEYAKWAGKRLPTEAEWEKAARGTDGRKYPWGNKWDASRLNCHESGYRTTVPVGTFPEGASPYGVMDMLGNVWEWTQDNYNPYPDSDFWTDKFGRQYKVFRGGSWNNYHFNNRCANRHREISHCSRSSHGFRCARSIHPERSSG